MPKEPIVVKDPPESGDNLVLPFQIEGMDVRGRTARLGTVVDQIISKHDYPEPVAIILGELLTLTTLLGSLLKYDGVVTVQIKGKGPVGMMVADYTSDSDSPGILRGYAQVDDDKLARLGKKPGFKALTGVGYMALTIDQGQDMERYQGIVELEGKTVADCAKNYFQNSEQTPTAISLAVHKNETLGMWRAGGIMVQHLSRGEEGRERILERETEENWSRANILMQSVKPEELTNPLLDSKELLIRLYHEDGVRVFDQNPIEFGCRCSRERLIVVLRSLSDEDINHAFEEESVITANCEFCNSDYKFSEDEVRSART